MRVGERVLFRLPRGAGGFSSPRSVTTTGRVEAVDVEALRVTVRLDSLHIDGLATCIVPRADLVQVY